MSEDAARCPRCGARLAGAFGGWCPACLLNVGLEQPSSANQTFESLTTEASSGLVGVTAAGARDVPDTIGPYRIIQMLGEGSMGRVYLAEQMEPIRRTVALKTIKLGMNTRDVVARFESERQALALMDHPNIARVIDAGATPF